jgi:hypothetical protein
MSAMFGLSFYTLQKSMTQLLESYWFIAFIHYFVLVKYIWMEWKR